MKANTLIAVTLLALAAALFVDYCAVHDRVNALEERFATRTDQMLTLMKISEKHLTLIETVADRVITLERGGTVIANAVLTLQQDLAAMKTTAPAAPRKASALLTRASYEPQAVVPDEGGTRRTYDTRDARNLGYRYQMLGAICHQGALEPDNAGRAEDLERASNYYFGAAAAFLWMAEERGQP